VIEIRPHGFNTIVFILPGSSSSFRPLDLRRSRTFPFEAVLQVLLRRNSHPVPTYFASQSTKFQVSMNSEDIHSAAHSPNGEFRRCDTPYLGCREAAGVLTPLAANLRARYRAKRHIYTDKILFTWLLCSETRARARRSLLF
jgi:hypothetical protein